MTSRQKRRYADLSRPRTTWDLTVELPDAGMRLDRFLRKRVDWRSRNELQTMIDESLVTVNGVVRKASTKLQVRDRVVIQLRAADEAPPDPSAIPIVALYEDPDLLVLDKQPGIVVHPVGRHQLTNLLSALHARYRNADAARDRVPHVCHRIDKDTSGVWLIAVSQEVKEDISRQFEERTVAKEYLALVHGVPEPREGTIDAPIRYREAEWPRLDIHAEGQPSVTDYRVEEAFADAALVRFFPRTGRTHQIRLHARWLGHPLLCDTAYGGIAPFPPEDSGEPPVLTRCALHAARLVIRHPRTGQPIEFVAPLPADMSAALALLRQR